MQEYCNQEESQKLVRREAFNCPPGRSNFLLSRASVIEEGSIKENPFHAFRNSVPCYVIHGSILRPLKLSPQGLRRHCTIFDSFSLRRRKIRLFHSPPISNLN